MTNRMGLTNGENGDETPRELMEIKPKDIDDLKVWLNTRFKGLSPACLFLSAFVGSQSGVYAREQKAKRPEAQELLSVFHNAMTEAFEQGFRGT